MLGEEKKGQMMKIEMWPVERVVPYEKNPRLNDEAVPAVAASIKKFGWRQPIVVDAVGVIIIGHTRRKAALSLGLAEVPVHVATDLSVAAVKALRLADNKTGELAKWDWKLLGAELDDIKALDFDLACTGFNVAELSGLLAGGGAKCGPNDLPEVPKVAVTKLGDMWLLGAHRLVCGDSTKPEDVAAATAGRVPFMMVTDPPYGVEYDPTTRSQIKRKGMKADYGGKNLGLVLNDHRADWSDAWKLFLGDVVYLLGDRKSNV